MRLKETKYLSTTSHGRWQRDCSFDSASCVAQIDGSVRREKNNLMTVLTKLISINTLSIFIHISIKVKPLIQKHFYQNII